MNRNNTVRASEMADHEKPAEADTRPGSVKAAVTSYRQRISEGNSKLNNFQTSFQEEIEEVNEEHVLVELARIEAIKEYEEIETQTREQAQIYASADGVDSASLLESVLKELVATKKELEQVKEGSFQFMASMDVVRDELMHVMDQTARLKKEEKETEMFIQSLNSKLVKAKTKLEETSAAEDKAKDIISNLKLTLEQLESEAATHEKEKSLSSEETAVVKAEIQKSETEIDSCEERLQAALQDLKAVKSSEALALKNLKSERECSWGEGDSRQEGCSCSGVG